MKEYIIKTCCGLPNQKFNFVINGETGKSWYDVGEVDENGYKQYCAMELIFIWLFFYAKIGSSELESFEINDYIEKYKTLNSSLKDIKINCIFDIGAHQGQYALAFSSMSDKVVSFEPCLENYNTLVKNIKINNINKIEAYNYFISCDNEQKKFTQDDKWRFNNENDSLLIGKCIKLDDMIDKITDDSLIKIDAEGEEIKILKGAEKILKNKNPNLIIELHDFCKDDHNEIKKLIDFNKYEILKINRKENKLKKFNETDDLKTINWLFLRKKQNFIKTFCLTLKDTVERKKYAQEHFLENGLDVQFFEGINGKKFGLETKIPYMDDRPNWIPDDGPMYFISSGNIGCILSHLMLWKTLSYLPYEEILIFEDDVVLCDNFKQKFLDYKNQLPEDWQYVFVGHCCLPSEEYQIKISENIITTTHPPMCTHAYMIKKSAIPILIETNSLAWSNIDIQIQKRTLKHLSFYIFNSPLAEQKSINCNSDKIFKSLTTY